MGSAKISASQGRTPVQNNLICASNISKRWW